VSLSKIWRLLGWWAVYWGPRRDFTVETSNGLLTFDSKDWQIGKYLYLKRRYEESQAREAIGSLRSQGYLSDSPSSGTVLDVGANIGMTSIGLVRQGYFRRAIASEPAPDNYRLLVRNIGQNGLRDRIQPFPIALSSLDGELDMELSRDNSGDNRIRQASAPGFFGEETRRTTKVRAATFDHFLAGNRALAAERVDLVWADIQGHELRFFQGAREFLSRGIPVVSEFWPHAIDRSGVSRSELVRILGDLFGYFFVVGRRPARKLPISEAESLLNEYAQPRQMCTAVFLPGRH